MSKRHRGRRRRHRRHPPGTAPGRIDRSPHAVETRIRVIAYGPAEHLDLELGQLEEVEALRERHPVLWIDVAGLADVDVIERLGQRFGLHPLALEDVTHVHQRAKVEDYGDHLFIVARMVDSGGEAVTEQVSLFLGKGFVLTFQERPGDCFDPVRQRIAAGGPNLRNGGADYLAYALLDAIIDGYFPAIEKHGDVLETLEEDILTDARPEIMARIQRAKAELQELRRAIRPHRDMINVLIRDEADSLHERTLLYMRDCHDHVIQAVDLLEGYREVASGLVDLYLSSVSNRMNEVMKVLTIIATIFIPLGFVAGLYGMNFDPDVSPFNMPELEWYWGYPAVLALMLGIGGGMLLWFRRRGWW